MALTLKKKAFAEHFAASGNATDAAKRAGYSEKNADKIGSQQLSDPKVTEYIAYLTQPACDARIMDIVERQVILSRIARDDEEQTKDRLKAIDQLSKVQGDYVERHQIENLTTISIREEIINRILND